MIKLTINNLYINYKYQNRIIVQNSTNPSFGSINVDKEDAINLRNIPYQCCACCGKPMISGEEYSSIKRKEYDGEAANVLKKLQKFSKYMRPTEKTVFYLLKRTSAKYPESDLNGLLKKRYFYHLGRLEGKQLRIINEISAMDLKLSEKSKEQLDKTLEKVHKIMFVESKDLPQKRSRIIKEFTKLKSVCKERNEIDKIIEIINKLPCSSNDVDAFMIKYVQRSNSEIGQRLLASSMPSLDHINARKNGGHDDFSNLIVMCKKCNEERGCESYYNLIKTHPRMPRNIRRNLKKVSREIKEGRLLNFDTYPQDVAETIKKGFPEQKTFNFDI